jgi:hypothetical protein
MPGQTLGSPGREFAPSGLPPWGTPPDSLDLTSLRGLSGKDQGVCPQMMEETAGTKKMSQGKLDEVGVQ